MQPRERGYDPSVTRKAGDAMFNAILSDMFPTRPVRLPETNGIFGIYHGIPVRAIPEIKKIYFNNKHTTIEWADGVKTTVGCIDGQEFDEYGGFAAAVLKRLFGSSKAAICYMDVRKVVQPEPVKKAKKTDETAVEQDA